jgi:ATP-dependent Lon protease
VLAAHRFGINTVILPKRNEKDLDDVPDEIRDEMTFVLADHVDQVLEQALSEPVPASDGDGGREAPAVDELAFEEAES